MLLPRLTTMSTPRDELMQLLHGTSVTVEANIRREGLRATATRPIPASKSRELAISDAKGAAAAAHMQGEDEHGLLITIEVDPALLEPDRCRPDPQDGQYLLRSPVAPDAILGFETISFRWGIVSLERTMTLAHHVALEQARQSGEPWRKPTPADFAAYIAEIKNLHAPIRERVSDRLEERLVESRQKRAEAFAKYDERVAEFKNAVRRWNDKDT